jgi:hypothetical protein
MAHYAFLDENGYVIEVIPGRNENEIVDGITNWEEYYGVVRGRKCVRTSYTGSFRGKYAGIGDFWDGTNFIAPITEGVTVEQA